MSAQSPALTLRNSRLNNRSRITVTLITMLITTLGMGGQNLQAFEPRTIDGHQNNPDNSDWGRADTPLMRLMTSDYADDLNEPAGSTRESPRAISNIMAAQDKSKLNARRASDFLWQWGQFIDHDIDLTEGAHPAEPFHIHIPSGDTYFDPKGTGKKTMPLTRSAYANTPNKPRQQVNHITAFLDGSMVYGSDTQRAQALRTNDGTGRLKMSKGRFLPYNVDGFPNAGGPAPELFLAGDIRVNEQVGLIAMHTLFVREHNRIAKNIRRQHSSMTGEKIYEKARRKVGALIQIITYNEFLPILLGKNALRPYRGYKPWVNPSIANVFSTAAYRLGHSMLSPQLLRLKKNGKPIRAGNLPLRNAFFAPWRITDEQGIAPILRGLARQQAQEVDPYIINDVRNFLFGPPGAGGFDLASLNIQRGRDHGLPSYNSARIAMGLEPVNTFSDITSDPELQQRLSKAYLSVEYIDVWVGGLAEDHHRQAMVGELFYSILKDQFERLRDGDRFWYQNTFSPKRISRLKRTTLADVIRRNTPIRGEIPNNVFRHKKHSHK
ncbi:MAG: peroxidase family protein [Nitrospirales bacterium]